MRAGSDFLPETGTIKQRYSLGMQGERIPVGASPYSGIDDLDLNTQTR
jgi:hypothetical protein